MLLLLSVTTTDGTSIFSPISNYSGESWQNWLWQSWFSQQLWFCVPPVPDNPFIPSLCFLLLPVVQRIKAFFYKSQSGLENFNSPRQWWIHCLHNTSPFYSRGLLLWLLLRYIQDVTDGNLVCHSFWFIYKQLLPPSHPSMGAIPHCFGLCLFFLDWNPSTESSYDFFLELTYICFCVMEITYDLKYTQGRWVSSILKITELIGWTIFKLKCHVVNR